MEYSQKKKDTYCDVDDLLVFLALVLVLSFVCIYIYIFMPNRINKQNEKKLIFMLHLSESVALFWTWTFFDKLLDCVTPFSGKPLVCIIKNFHSLPQSVRMLNML